MEPAVHLYFLTGAYLSIGVIAIVAQAALAESALERAAPSDELRKWTNNNAYWEL